MLPGCPAQASHFVTCCTPISTAGSRFRPSTCHTLCYMQVLCDFGLARILETTRTHAAFTTRTMQGTPYYMWAWAASSDEQLQKIQSSVTRNRPPRCKQSVVPSGLFLYVDMLHCAAGYLATLTTSRRMLYPCAAGTYATSKRTP